MLCVLVGVAIFKCDLRVMCLWFVCFFVFVDLRGQCFCFGFQVGMRWCSDSTCVVAVGFCTHGIVECQRRFGSDVLFSLVVQVSCCWLSCSVFI